MKNSYPYYQMSFVVVVLLIFACICKQFVKAELSPSRRTRGDKQPLIDSELILIDDNKRESGQNAFFTTLRDHSFLTLNGFLKYLNSEWIVAYVDALMSFCLKRSQSDPITNVPGILAGSRDRVHSRMRENETCSYGRKQTWTALSQPSVVSHTFAQ